MIEGWRQILRDIRAVLGLPINQPESRQDEEGNKGGYARSTKKEYSEPIDSEKTRNADNTIGNNESEVPSFTDSIDHRNSNGHNSNAHLEEANNRKLRKWWTIVVLLLLFSGSLLFREKLFGSRAPSPGVVVTFDGGQITIEDIQKHIKELSSDESQLNEELQTVKGYRAIAEEMVTDELVRRWSETRNVQQEQDLSHMMEHIEEDINLGDFDTALHDKGMGVSEEEVKSYYDANREKFGEMTLTQARDKIRIILETQQEGEYVGQYLDNLRANASITRNLELLEVPEPSELDYRKYFSDNEDQFQAPARVTVDEIQIPIGDDIEVAKDKASQILIRLRSGETLSTISSAPITNIKRGLKVISGQKPSKYDEIINNLGYDEISEVFLAGESFYILRLISKEPQRKMTLPEAKPAIREIIIPEIQEQWFKSKGNQTLLTVNGRRLTVGEFWQEFKELSAVFASKYQGVSGWKLLTERLIDRLLLLEDSSRKLPDTKDSIALEEAKLDVLSQMMEQEKVDDRIEITDQVLKTYYEKVKKDLIRPPQSQIRFIMFELGQSEDESNRAWDRAKEAYELLNPGLFKEGANFAEVAREYSDDEISAEKGGLLEGWIGEGPDLFMEVGIHNFHQEVQSLDVGEIGRPFEWNGSVYIIQVMDRTEVEQLSFEEVKHYLSEELRSQKHKELRDELSLQLLEQYNVEFFVKELKSALDER